MESDLRCKSQIQEHASSGTGFPFLQSTGIKRKVPCQNQMPKHVLPRKETGTKISILQCTSIDKKLSREGKGPIMPSLGTVQYVMQRTELERRFPTKAKIPSIPSSTTTAHVDQCTGLERKLPCEGQRPKHVITTNKLTKKFLIIGMAL